MRASRFFTVGGMVILCVMLIHIEPTYTLEREVSYGSVHRIVNAGQSKASRRISQPAELARVSREQFRDGLVFVGDILLARNVEMLMERRGAIYPFAGFDLTTLVNDSAIIGNFESAVPEQHEPTPAYHLQFSTQVSALDALTDHGFSHVSIANNHSLDFGMSGLAHTIQQLYNTDLQVFGEVSGFEYDSISYVDSQYGTIALIGFDDTMRPLEDSEINRVLRRARDTSDLQIVFIHWGVEYEERSSVRQRTVAQKLVAAGADLIVGHHPHVVQEVALVAGVPVFYSLGNYIFDQYFSEEVQTGLVLAVRFKPQPALELYPVESRTAISQPRPLTGDKKAVFLYELSQRSTDDIAEYLKRGVIPFEKSFASTPKTAMIDQQYVY